MLCNFTHAMPQFSVQQGTRQTKTLKYWVIIGLACLRQEASNICDTAADTSKRGADAATEVTKDVSGEVTQAAGDITDAAKQSVEDAWGSVKDTTQKIKDTVVGKAEESTESVKRSAKSIKPNFTA
ncbi:hypothetical protein WN944_016588 [Citrus x changshan-huyou]|uniref:Uncharacterized protein n=1 Tax=Citrus x changshan-huyou TaxID=2935761 RepID=A0AAP0ME15_9ROSI